jgi:hypothetical protein
MNDNSHCDSLRLLLTVYLEQLFSFEVAEAWCSQLNFNYTFVKNRGSIPSLPYRHGVILNRLSLDIIFPCLKRSSTHSSFKMTSFSREADPWIRPIYKCVPVLQFYMLFPTITTVSNLGRVIWELFRTCDPPTLPRTRAEIVVTSEIRT